MPLSRNWLPGALPAPSPGMDTDPRLTGPEFILRRSVKHDGSKLKFRRYAAKRFGGATELIGRGFPSRLQITYGEFSPKDSFLSSCVDEFHNIRCERDCSHRIKAMDQCFQSPFAVCADNGCLLRSKGSFYDMDCGA